jgi:hypothetical protein
MTLGLRSGVLPGVSCGMTTGATPSGVPPSVSANDDSRAAQACVPSSVSASNGFEAPRPGVSPVFSGGMTIGALPVGLISLSDDDPEDKEGYEGTGDNGRLKLSKGNQNAVIKTLWLRIGSPTARGQTEVHQQLHEILTPSKWVSENQKKRLQRKKLQSRHLTEGKR